MQNPLFNNDWLITDTGAIDHEFIKVSAEARARFRYGADCGPGDITDYLEKLNGLAAVQADKFRRGEILRHGRAA